MFVIRQVFLLDILTLISCFLIHIPREKIQAHRMHIIRGKSRRPDFVYRQALFFVKWLLLLINLYGYR